MRAFILGAIVVWFLFGIAGAILLGQQRIEVRTIASGPIAFWHGLDKPGQQMTSLGRAGT